MSSHSNGKDVELWAEGSHEKIKTNLNLICQAIFLSFRLRESK